MENIFLHLYVKNEVKMNPRIEMLEKMWVGWKRLGEEERTLIVIFWFLFAFHTLSNFSKIEIIFSSGVSRVRTKKRDQI